MLLGSRSVRIDDGPGTPHPVRSRCGVGVACQEGGVDDQAGGTSVPRPTTGPRDAGARSARLRTLVSDLERSLDAAHRPPRRSWWARLSPGGRRPRWTHGAAPTARWRGPVLVAGLLLACGLFGTVVVHSWGPDGAVIEAPYTTPHATTGWDGLDGAQPAGGPGPFPSDVQPGAPWTVPLYAQRVVAVGPVASRAPHPDRSPPSPHRTHTPAPVPAAPAVFLTPPPTGPPTPTTVVSPPASPTPSAALQRMPAASPSVPVTTPTPH